MAVYWTRTAEVAWGKDAQALAWAKRIMGYLNDAYPECPGEVLTNIGGSLGQIHWARKHRSLAEMEAYGAKVEADEQYHALVKEMVEGGFLMSASDHLYQVEL